RQLAVVKLPVEMAEHLTDLVEATGVLGRAGRGSHLRPRRLDRGGVLVLVQADGAAGEVAAQPVLAVRPLAVTDPGSVLRGAGGLGDLLPGGAGLDRPVHLRRVPVV